jgi:hypothetical protein
MLALMIDALEGAFKSIIIRASETGHYARNQIHFQNKNKKKTYELTSLLIIICLLVHYFLFIYYENVFFPFF